MIHIWRPWIVQFLRPPTPLSIYVQNSSTPLILDVQFQTNPYPPSYSPNDNQSVKRKQFKEDYYMLSGPSFRSAVVFSINSLILSVAFLRLLFIYLKPHHLLFHGWTHVCSVAQKYHEIPFIYNYSHFKYTHFAINLFHLHNLKT